MYQGNSPSLFQNKRLDNLVFDGVATSFSLTSNGVAIFPANPESVIFSINGVIQSPVSAFTISGSIITFSSAPSNGAPNFGVVLGNKFQLADAVPLSGGTMTGYLTLNGVPTLTNHAATKAYVDSVSTSIGTTTFTLSQLNTSVSDADVVSVAGTETLTNKTLISPDITDNISIITAGTTAVRGRTYVLNATGITLTLPATPAINDRVDVINRAFSDCVIGRNGSNIMELAENMTVDAQYVTFSLVYANSTIGWMIK